MSWHDCSDDRPRWAKPGETFDCICGARYVARRKWFFFITWELVHTASGTEK